MKSIKSELKKEKILLERVERKSEEISRCLDSEMKKLRNFRGTKSNFVEKIRRDNRFSFQIAKIDRILPKIHFELRRVKKENREIEKFFDENSRIVLPNSEILLTEKSEKVSRNLRRKIKPIEFRRTLSNENVRFRILRKMLEEKLTF